MQKKEKKIKKEIYGTRQTKKESRKQARKILEEDRQRK